MFAVYRVNPDGSETYIRLFEHEIDAADYVYSNEFVLDSYGFMCPTDYRKV